MKRLLLDLLILVGIFSLSLESVKSQTYLSKKDAFWQRDSLLIRQAIIDLYSNKVGQVNANLLATDILSQNLPIKDSVEFGENYRFLLLILRTEELIEKYDLNNHKYGKSYLKIVVHKSFDTSEILILSKHTPRDRKRFKYLSYGLLKSDEKKLHRWLHW